MNGTARGKSNSWILLGFLLIIGATLPVPASEHCPGAAGTPYGNIEGDDPMITDTATAVRFTAATDSQGFPAAAAWELTPALRFDADWQGKNPDALRETEVRLLWTPETLYLRFRARYRAITVFPDSDANGRRDHLWDRDVAEAFLQPDSSELRHYKEFEISPNGFWIDLDIVAGEKRDLHSGQKRRVQVDENKKLWAAELAIPMKSLVARFDLAASWRVNFYRVEGAAEPRFYSAWRPTGTPQPNFHVPEAFGRLIFVETPASGTAKNASPR
jgi:alpha-galactosidase